MGGVTGTASERCARSTKLQATSVTDLWQSAMGIEYAVKYWSPFCDFDTEMDVPAAIFLAFLADDCPPTPTLLCVFIYSSPRSYDGTIRLMAL